MVFSKDMALSASDSTNTGKYQRHEELVQTDNYSVLSVISICISVATIVLLLFVVYIVFRLRKKLNVPSKVALSNGVQIQSVNGAPDIINGAPRAVNGALRLVSSPSDDLHYDNEVNDTVGRGHDDIRRGPTNESGPDYVNDASHMPRNNQGLYEGLVSECTQHTYEALTK